MIRENLNSSAFNIFYMFHFVFYKFSLYICIVKQQKINNMFKCYHYTTIFVIYFMLATLHIVIKDDTLFICWFVVFLLAHLVFILYLKTDSYEWELTWKDKETYNEYEFNPISGRIKAYNTFMKRWDKRNKDDSDWAIEQNVPIALTIASMTNIMVSLFYGALILIHITH